MNSMSFLYNNYTGGCKIKLGNRPHYLKKTFSSQAKIVDRTSVSRTRASSKNSVNRRSLSTLGAPNNTLSYATKQSPVSSGNQGLKLNSSEASHNFMKTAQRSLSVTEMQQTKKVVRKTGKDKSFIENADSTSITKQAIHTRGFKDMTSTMNKKLMQGVLHSSCKKKQGQNSEGASNNRSSLFNSTMERINAKTQIKRFQVPTRLSSNSHSLS